MKSNPHILFITPGFPDGEGDSRCIPALQVFAKALLKEGVRVTVISLHYPYSPKHYKWFGIDVYGLGGGNRKGLKRLSTWRKALSLGKQIHKRELFTHVQSFWLGECTWLGNKLAEKLRLKHACTLMGQDVLKPNPWVKRIKKLPPLVALSYFHQRMLKESFGLTAKHLIPWGVEASQVLDLTPKKIDIIGVGNLIDLKNYQRFLQIVKKVSEAYPGLKVCLIGDGEEREILENKIDELKLQKIVKLSGFLSREKVLEKMKQSKTLLHCSTFESFGMVVIEALANGIKVFSTPVGIAAQVESVTTVEDDEVTATRIVEYLKQEENQQNRTIFSIKTTAAAYLKSVF